MSTDNRVRGQHQAPTLVRETFRTSRLLDFCSQRELVKQIGHPVESLGVSYPQGIGRQRPRCRRGSPEALAGEISEKIASMSILMRGDSILLTIASIYPRTFRLIDSTGGTA